MNLTFDAKAPTSDLYSATVLTAGSIRNEAYRLTRQLDSYGLAGIEGGALPVIAIIGLIILIVGVALAVAGGIIIGLCVTRVITNGDVCTLGNVLLIAGVAHIVVGGIIFTAGGGGVIFGAGTAVPLPIR